MRTTYPHPNIGLGCYPAASVTLLPSCPEKDRENALRFARSAAHVAHATGSLLFAAVCHPAGAVTCHGLPRTDLDAWSDFGEVQWQFSATTARHLLLLQVLGRQLGETLMARWHPGAEPAHLGILSDGVAVGICPVEPEPTNAGWAQRLFRGELPLSLFDDVASGTLFEFLIKRGQTTLH